MEDNDGFIADEAIEVEVVAEQETTMGEEQIVEVVGAENCMATCSG